MALKKNSQVIAGIENDHNSINNNTNNSGKYPKLKKDDDSVSSNINSNNQNGSKNLEKKLTKRYGRNSLENNRIGTLGQNTMRNRNSEKTGIESLAQQQQGSNSNEIKNTDIKEIKNFIEDNDKLIDEINELSNRNIIEDVTSNFGSSKYHNIKLNLNKTNTIGGVTGSGGNNNDNSFPSVMPNNNNANSGTIKH